MAESKYSRKDFDDAIREIICGMVLFPRTDAEHAHNNACERAISIVRAYREGEGLFQMTRGERPDNAEQAGKDASPTNEQ